MAMVLFIRILTLLSVVAIASCDEVCDETVPSRSLLQRNIAESKVAQPSGDCSDVLGGSNKPWDDFVSCEEEKAQGACADNDVIKRGCKATCGLCGEKDENNKPDDKEEEEENEQDEDDSMYEDPECEDELGSHNKPWDDFISCADEKSACADNTVIQRGCKATCGLCGGDDGDDDDSMYEDPECEDELGSHNKPWDDFISCADEKSACADNTVIQRGCKATCGLCGGDDDDDDDDDADDDDGDDDDALPKSTSLFPTTTSSTVPGSGPGPNPSTTSSSGGLACEDELGSHNKPWSDFISCDDEKPACADNIVVQRGCKATCGLCGVDGGTPPKSTSLLPTTTSSTVPTPGPSPTSSTTSPSSGEPACEDELGSHNKPWDDFISCADEKSACADNTVIQRGCKATCGLCGGDDGAPSKSTSLLPTTTSPTMPAPGPSPTPSPPVCSDGCKDVDWMTCSPDFCSWAKPYCPCTCGICGQSFNCTCSDPNGVPATSYTDGCTANDQEMCKCNKGYRSCSHEEEQQGKCGDGDCIAFSCDCNAANGESMNSFSDVAEHAVGPACWQDGRGGCQKKCNSEDCNVANPVFLGASASQKCAGVAKGLLGSGCCVSSECCVPASKSDKVWSDELVPVPVDFLVFKRSKANRFFTWDEYNSDRSELVRIHKKLATACEDVPVSQTGQVPCQTGLPWAPSNMGGSDGCSGFCRSVAIPKALPFNGTALTHCNNPFDFDEEIAQLTIVDMNNDFAQLGVKGPTFVMGDYKVVEGETALGSIDDLISLTEADPRKKHAPTGHDLLNKLMWESKDTNDVLYPKPGRITVWVPNTEISAGLDCYDKTTTPWKLVDYDAEKEAAGELLCVPMVLLGSTFQGMSVNQGLKKGAGTIMAAECQRRGHRYSHEVGHIVGFGHADYDNDPNAPCGTNIMGGGSGPSGCSQKPQPQFTFTAGATTGNHQSGFPSIFADWRNKRSGPLSGASDAKDETGEPSTESEEHESLLQSASTKSTADVFLRCADIQAKFGKEALHHIMGAGRASCLEWS